MPRQFDDYDYTRDAIIKQLSLIELHGKDGSAVDAGCACIETKHTYMLEGLSEEMVGFAKSEKEKQFYQQLSDLARQLRKKIDSEDWDMHGMMKEVIKAGYAVPMGNSGKTIVPYNDPQLPKITLFYDKKCVAENYTRSDSDEVNVCLSPKLKKYPNIHNALLKHEMDEGVCNQKTSRVCHQLALMNEPEPTRKLKTEKELFGNLQKIEKQLSSIKCPQ